MHPTIFTSCFFLYHLPFLFMNILPPPRVSGQLQIIRIAVFLPRRIRHAPPPLPPPNPISYGPRFSSPRSIPRYPASLIPVTLHYIFLSSPSNLFRCTPYNTTLCLHAYTCSVWYVINIWNIKLAATGLLYVYIY